MIAIRYKVRQTTYKGCFHFKEMNLWNTLNVSQNAKLSWSWKITVTKIVWCSTPISIFDSLLKWHDARITNVQNVSNFAVFSPYLNFRLGSSLGLLALSWKTPARPTMFGRSINFFTFEVTGDLKTASSFLHETKRRAWQSYTFEPHPCQIARVLSMLKVMTNVFHR